jgi:hypothetical protein
MNIGIWGQYGKIFRTGCLPFKSHCVVNSCVLRIALTRCPTTNEWIKKMWYLYTMEFYAAMKKNEMLSLAGKWIELENVILSEVSLAQNTKNPMFSLICGH